MPCDYKKYPKHWKVIRAHILARAENRCECRGNCGADHVEFDAPTRCDAPHGKLIQRHRDQKDRWVPAYSSMGNLNHGAPITVILTTAHLCVATCADTKCARLDHLLVLCQFCHLRLDQEQHQKSRRATLAQKAGA